jgi:GNAT superfamily N-acetyltransferase
VIIRDAVAADAPELARLMALLGHDLDPATLADRLALTPLPTLVAVEAGQVIGLCGLAKTVHIHRDQPVGRITILVVAEDARGRGVGSRLIDEAGKRLADAGCAFIEVTSNLRFEEAHDFYEARGFIRTSYRFYRQL